MAADQAFVTCVTNDTYALGALVLGHSLRNVQTSKQLAVIITHEVSEKIREQLGTVFDHIEVVNVLDSKDEINLALLSRPDLGVTFTKFHCWRLTRYKKCVFLDADTLVVQNCDELFDREELSAVPDVGWPDCFNSGVFVFQPSVETYKNILNFAVVHGSFDGGDQGVLNMFFSEWRTSDISKHLSFIYNMNANVTYTYQPAYKQFGKDVKIVHFLGAIKPWMQAFNSESGKVEPDSPHSLEHLQMWWDVFMKQVQPNLSQECKGLAGDLARMHLGWPSPGGTQMSSEARKYAWERGQIDYMGADAFENIERKLQTAIGEDRIDRTSNAAVTVARAEQAAAETHIKSLPRLDSLPVQAAKEPLTFLPRVEPLKVITKVEAPAKCVTRVDTPAVEPAKVESPKTASPVQSPIAVSPKGDAQPLKEVAKVVDAPTKAQPAAEATGAVAKKPPSQAEPVKKSPPAAQASAKEPEKKPPPKKEAPSPKKEPQKKTPSKKSPK